MDENDEQHQKQNSSTKVYYYLDDSTPYMSQIPVPVDQLTLADFKMNFGPKGYSYFCKEWDPDLKQEVKVEITHDQQLLRKSANGLIELFLLSQNSVGHHHHNQKTSSRHYDGNNKPYRTREKRKRYRRSPPSSFMSSTFEDTEVSMAMDLITVTFNMDTRRPFGMSVVVKRNHTYYVIVVHEITPNGLVALDGRIKPGYILLEVNGIPLDGYDTPEESVTIFSNAVRNAIENRGQLKLTCTRVARPMHTFFRPPVTEPVCPIDPAAWVQHTNSIRSLNMEEIPTDFGFSTAFFMNVPKYGTDSNLPKIGAEKRFQHLKAEETKIACDQSTSPMKQSTGIKIIQNRSTEITTASNNSSLESSIGHQQQQDEEIEQDQESKSSGNSTGGDGQRHGRIGSAIRRLVSSLTNKKGKTTSRKRKANSTKRSGKK